MEGEGQFFSQIQDELFAIRISPAIKTNMTTWDTEKAFYIFCIATTWMFWL